MTAVRNEEGFPGLFSRQHMVRSLITTSIAPGERSVSTAAVSRDSYRVRLEAVLDDPNTVQRLRDLHNDQDTAFELVQAWTETERLSRRLADLTRARTKASRSEAATIAREQMAIVTAIEVTALTAQAYAAGARTELATVGGRVVSPEGHVRATQLAQTALALAPDAPGPHYVMGDSPDRVRAAGRGRGPVSPRPADGAGLERRANEAGGGASTAGPVSGGARRSCGKRCASTPGSLAATATSA